MKRLECDCENGGRCSRIAVCRAQAVTDRRMEEIDELLDLVLPCRCEPDSLGSCVRCQLDAGNAASTRDWGFTATARLRNDNHRIYSLLSAAEAKLKEARELLLTSADEMEESCENEGRLTSMKVAAERIRAFLNPKGGDNG